MISMLVYGHQNTEISLLVQTSKEIVAELSNETLVVTERKTRGEQKLKLEEIEEFDGVQAAIIDVTIENGLHLAQKIRKINPYAEMVIVADAKTSPITYLNPSVKASALVLKPFGKKILREALTPFYMQICVEETDDDFFIVEKRDESVKLPYSKIIFLEAREKRIFVRSGNMEYGINETIDGLIELLPDNFFRCHRSYVVNINFIKLVKFSENKILLDYDITIPLSRSYKNDLKEVIKNVK